MQRKLIVMLLFLCLSFVLNPGVAQTQGAIDSITINSVDSSSFPQVAIRFRPLDNQERPIEDLSLNNIRVTEDGDEVVPERLDSAEDGLWVHFVIDAGAGIKGEPERWTRARSVISDFLSPDSGMKNGLDHVALSVIEPGGVRNLVDYATSSQELSSALSNYQLPEGLNYSAPIPALESILQALDRKGGADGQAKLIVFISSGIETGNRSAVNSLNSTARNLDISLFATLVRTSPRLENNMIATEDDPAPEPRDELLRELANGTGGAFTHYRNSGEMDDIFQEWASQRQQYDVVFRSHSGKSGSRQVQISSVSGSASDFDSYSVEVNPPRALIESPGDGEIIERKSDEFVADRSVLSPASRTVVGSVVFPDNHSRRLLKATLYVNGQVAASRANPSNDFELTWDLRPVQADGMTDLALEVVVEDELGLEATSQPIAVKVDVFVPPQPTPEVETIVERVMANAATPTSIPCVSPDPICARLERPVRTEVAESPTAAVSMAIATVSLVFAGLVYVNRDKAPVVAARNTVIGAVERLTNRYKRSEPIAYLEVIQGDSNTGKLLEIYGDTPIGRARQVGAELLFHQDDDNSPISRLHCTILNEEDHFLLRDEDSANGTFLNGVRLEPMVPEPVHYGDRIELARVERGGVLLQLQIAEDGPMGEDLRETRQTRNPERFDDDIDEEFEDRF